MPRKIAVVDCETDPFRRGRTIVAPFLWGFYDGEYYHEFENILDLVSFLEDKPLVVYAHNGGKFDWHFLISLIEPFTELLIINGRLSRFRIGKCEFRDSFNIIPVSLATYQKTKINYDIMEKDVRYKTENMREIRAYLRDDCVFLFDLVSRFVGTYGNHLTLATTAVKTWEKMSGRKAPKDIDGEIYEKFRPFYHGGRCQNSVTGIIENDFSMVDICSAYPFAMLRAHPIGLEYVQLSYQEWLDLPPNDQGTCLVRVRGTSRGCLPFKGRDGTLYFPDDSICREYSCTGWEIIAGLETNALDIHDFVECYYFPEQCSFSDYITYFYQSRQAIKNKILKGHKLTDDDKADLIFYKILMNSLYGKFGSNPSSYHNYQNIPSDFITRNGTVMIEDYNGDQYEWDFNGDFGHWALVSKALEEDEMRFYNVATAASITGFVRAYMWRAINACDGLIYCDTDSIAAHSIGTLPGGYGTSLGQWEIEGHFDHGAVCGRKLYAFHKKNMPWLSARNYKVASKGVKLTPAQLYRIARGDTVEYTAKSISFSVHRPAVQLTRSIKAVNKRLTE